MENHFVISNYDKYSLPSPSTTLMIVSKHNILNYKEITTWSMSDVTFKALTGSC